MNTRECLGDWNYASTTGLVTSEGILAITPLIPYLQGCNALSYKHCVDNVLNARIYVVDENMKAVANQKGPGSGSTLKLNETMMANARYVMMAFDVEHIDDCFILDVTHNIYLFKGKNV